MDFSGAKRKIIVLYRNGTVKFFKKTIQHITTKDKLNGAQWVLIPVQGTSATYIAVDAHRILEYPFDIAIIRYHLQFKRFSRSSEFADLNGGIVTAYDYLTTSVSAFTCEELYNAIYNIMTFKYCRELGANNDGEEAWFIDVEDIDIRLERRGKEIDHLKLRRKDFSREDFSLADYDRSIKMYDAICDHFGLYYPNTTKGIEMLWESSATLTIEMGNDGLIWKEHNKPVDLFTRIKFIGTLCVPTRGFLLLTRHENEQALRMQTAAVFITPISLYETSCTQGYLPICNMYGMPKYEFWPDIALNGMDDSGPDMLYNDFAQRVYDILTFYIYDGEDIGILIDHLSMLMKIFFEGCKIWTASMANRDDIENMEQECTVYFNVAIELSGYTPGEAQLNIHTDVFEEYPPNIKEVTYLLGIQDPEDDPDNSEKPF